MTLWQNQNRLAIAAAFALVAAGVIHTEGFGTTLARADEPTSLTRSVPEPLEDDATLRAIATPTAGIAVAVGDRGTIWRTVDAGKTWKFSRAPKPINLKSVCFIDSETGWAAGSCFAPGTGLDFGVVIATEDGGETWKSRGDSSLGSIHYIEFFDTENGIAAGASTPRCATGLWKTQDGGTVWEPIEGRSARGWATAVFADAGMGLLASPDDGLVPLSEQRLLPARIPPFRRQAPKSLAMGASGNGYLVGTGGLVLATESGGSSWKPIESLVDLRVQGNVDFHAADAIDDCAWFAGSPGTVVWRTVDSGQTWNRHSTGQTTPLFAIRFSDSENGYACGALGQILATSDGGVTWKAARAAGRRLAALAVVPRQHELGLMGLGHVSLEHGYRTAATVLIPPSTGPLQTTHSQASSLSASEQLNTAIIGLGGAGGRQSLDLPLMKPGLETDVGALTQDWQSRTEGKLANTLIGQLVRDLRMWKPTVVLANQPRDNDAVGQLVLKALRTAIQRAADPTAELVLNEQLALEPWTVNRLVLQLPLEADGGIRIAANDYWPHADRLARQAVELPRQNLGLTTLGKPPTETYRVESAAAVDNGSVATNVVGDSFFAGLSLPADGSARRPLRSIDEDVLAAREKQFESQKHFDAIASEKLKHPLQAATLLAALGAQLRQRPRDEGASLLMDLATQHTEYEQWELAELVHLELFSRFPDSPEALTAARWCLQNWISREHSHWHTMAALRSENVETGTANQIRQAAGLGQPATATKKLSNANANALAGLGSAKARQALLGRATQLISQISKSHPVVVAEPESQFQWASLRRQLGDEPGAEGVYQRLSGATVAAQVQTPAKRELWLARPIENLDVGFLKCLKAKTKPLLDGDLSDEIWAEASEISLQPEAAAGTAVRAKITVDSATSIMLGYDDEFLYLAGRCRRASGTNATGIEWAGRQRDEVSPNHDSVSVFLDLDRDYQTWFELTVDESGKTRDACTGDLRWNPNWFVAVDGDDEIWRFEAAIPIAELQTGRISRRDAWAVGIIRTIPKERVECWLPPATIRPQPAAFGLARFE